jgi:hypothetical protein
MAALPSRRPAVVSSTALVEVTGAPSLAPCPAAFEPCGDVNGLPFEPGLVCLKGESTPANQEENMKNPLDSLWGTIISGLVLTLILYWIVKLALGS